MPKELLIVIPAYRAAPTLIPLLDRIREQAASSVCDIMVVDDGSADRTTDIAKSKGVFVLTHAVNLGKGEALKTGFRFALENGYASIVTMDADLQHDPASLPSLLDYFSRETFDIVIGSRKFDPAKMSAARRMSNSITSWLLSLRTGQRIPDSQSGYRVIRTNVLKAIHLTTSGYETESELLIRAAKSGFRIGFVPVGTIYAGETSHIRHLRDTLRFIRMYVNTFFN